MPKDEFDFDDPMELSGVGLFTHEDTTDEMANCFIEEFMRLGYGHKQVLALFRNPHYTGMNMVLQNRGEEFVREKISEIFASWGKKADWGTESPPPKTAGESTCTSEQKIEFDPQATDPMGAAIPKLNF